jgi:hypothetical protein
MSRDSKQSHPDARRILAVSVTTSTKTPLVGVVEWQTTDGAFACEINEEIAYALSSDLDHFLSQQ